MTGAFKYLLIQLLMISTGDDPEADEHTDRSTPIEPLIEPNQLFALEALITQTAADEAKIKLFCQIEHLSEMTRTQYAKVTAMLEKKKEPK